MFWYSLYMYQRYGYCKNHHSKLMYTISAHCTNCQIVAPFMVPCLTNMTFHKTYRPIKNIPFQHILLLINYQYSCSTDQHRLLISIQTYNTLASDAKAPPNMSQCDNSAPTLLVAMVAPPHHTNVLIKHHIKWFHV